MDALALIQKHEGLRLKIYDDATGKPLGPGSIVVGHPTIGYGRSLDIDGITPQEALDLTTNELPHREADLKLIFPAPKWEQLGAARQAALIDMHYALGTTGFRDFHVMVTALLNQQWDTAAGAMLGSLWGREAPSRVHEDAAIILSGVFAA